MAGAFAVWQPRYAEHGIATFPVRQKRPAVKGYLRVGIGASRTFAEKYPDAASFGFALKPANVAVVDVDTGDELVLADALDRHGPTPIIVRSGGGHFQAWYRRGAEGRSIRPDPAVPVDILGDGYVIAPPSMGAKGAYQIIQGGLDDLDRLPAMRPAPSTPVQAPVHQGARNNTLWRRCMEEARHCDDFDAMLDVANGHNAGFSSALPLEEVVKVARSAWRYTEEGRNWFGTGKRIVSTFDEVDGLMNDRPDAYLLLMRLRRLHRTGEDFKVANAMAEAMPGGKWRRERFTTARRHLEDCGLLEMVHPPSSFHGPAVYRLKGAQK